MPAIPRAASLVSLQHLLSQRAQQEGVLSKTDFEQFQKTIAAQHDRTIRSALASIKMNTPIAVVQEVLYYLKTGDPASVDSKVMHQDYAVSLWFEREVCASNRLASGKRRGQSLAQKTPSPR